MSEDEFGERIDADDEYLNRSGDDVCYRCDHERFVHLDDCAGIWNGDSCPCPEFDEAEHWHGIG